METFYYEATTRDGNIVTGTLEVTNERLAIDRIQDMGYFPLKVSKAVKRENLVMRLFSSVKNRITTKDVMVFTYQIGVLLDAGFTLDKSLSILSELTDKETMKELTKDVLSQVKGGRSFSEALQKYPSVFPLFYVNMIKAGEAGGFLENTISRMAVYLENTEGLKEEVRSALIYPLILSVVGGAAVIVLLTFVVPQFAKIFTDMGSDLPLPTVILLAVSGTLVKYWWMILILVTAVAVLMKRYFRSEDGRRTWDRMKFNLPVFGKLFKETAVSRFARTLGTLLGSGVPIMNALQIVKGTLGSDRISEIIADVRESVRKGRGLSEPLRKSDIIPPLAVHMVTVGEETGRLDEMLIKIADRFDLEVRTTVKRLLSLLEPVLILVMGIMVGFIVIAMLTAIFSINELPF
ncbi:MAG: type II secretion system F family protein [Nitrospiraceae bacterium]|nr:MAG: type II secretion system F family protein [Nitrospiraceae bacterium]